MGVSELWGVPQTLPQIKHLKLKEWVILMLFCRPKPLPTAEIQTQYLLGVSLSPSCKCQIRPQTLHLWRQIISPISLSVFISISLIHCGDWKFNFYTPWTNSSPRKIGLKGPFLQRLGPGVKQLHPQYNGGRFVFLLLEMVKRKESPKPKGFPNGELITW